MSRYRNRRRISVSTIILIVLAIVGVVFGTVHLINRGKKVNENNLLAVDEYQIVDRKTAIGLTIDVKDDGKIFVSGKATSDFKTVIQSVELDKGTYTVGGCNSNAGTYGIAVEKNGTVIAYAGVEGDQGETFTVDEKGTYDVTLFVKEGTNLYRTFAPTLAAGKKTISFYS